MPSNHTTNYQLSQWAKSDKVLMDDFNADNAKIDAAIKAEADARAALAARTGNCTVGVFTYQGTDTYGQDDPTRITFPRVPTAFIVFGMRAILIGRGGQSQAIVDSFASGNPNYVYIQPVTLTWSGASCTLYASSNARLQMNETGLHTVIAFYTEG